MPIKPPPPVALYGDLERARQIACAWKLVDQLSPADNIAKAIAQGIAEGRSHGLQIAKAEAEASGSKGSSGEELTHQA